MKTRLIRVDIDVYDYLKRESQREKKSIPKTTRKLLKRGDIRSIFTILIALVAIGLALIFVTLMYTAFSGTLESGGYYASTPALQEAKDTLDYGIYTVLDFVPLIIYIGGCVALLISSLFIPTHPIFFYLNILGMIALAFTSPILANVYGTIIESPGVQAYLAASPIPPLQRTTFLIHYLPFFSIPPILISTLYFYGKRSGGPFGS